MTLARSVRQPFVWAIFHAGVDTDKPRLADSSARARVDRLRTVDLRPYRRNVLVTLTCLSAHCSTLFSAPAGQYDSIIRSMLDPTAFGGIFQTWLEVVAALAQAHRPPVTEALNRDPLPFGFAQATHEMAHNMERDAL
jgi:hypothetical protein